VDLSAQINERLGAKKNYHLTKQSKIRYLYAMTKKNSIQHTSDSDLTHSMAHYLLTIHKLKETKGYARVTDIAKDMGLTKGSVSTALTNLKKKELVVEDESKFLSLSERGHDEVHSILTSRTLLYYFLKDILKVDEEVAHKDSCLMEHLLSDDTREKFFQFMKLASSEPSKIKYKTELDLSQFKNHDEFLHAQKGDKYLE
jgi:DtxR family Mn-dependent transcriptional regulator